jgi:type IV pilus assembly protein PilV
MRGPGCQRGTTLIEVLVSTVLLAIGLLGLVGLHARAAQTTVDAENRSNAVMLANELTAAMWTTHQNTDGTALSTAFSNWQAVASRALPGGSYTVGAADASGAVQITINWTAPGQQSATQTVNNRFVTTVAIP